MLRLIRRFPQEEVSKRGRAIFTDSIAPRLGKDADNLYCAIDVDTEQYELNSNPLVASEQLRRRIPDAQIWMERVGHPTASRIGGHRKQDA